MDRGNRLKILRILCGQSQDVLSRNLGLSQGNVATWERKGMFPRDPEIAKKLAELLQAPVGYLAFGDPLIDCAVWEPQPPQSPRHLKSYITEIRSLFPEFCMENQIEICAYYSAENGKIIFLGQAGKPLSYLLLTKPVIAECFLEAIGGARVEEIEGIAGYPPLTIFFDRFDLEQLETYIRFLEVKGYSIDTQAIGAALVKTRMSQNWGIDIPHSLENTFNIFFSELKKYDVPKDWPDELILRLSPVFNRLHELIVEKPLVGQVLKDDSLAEYIAPMLIGCGLKKRNRERGSVRGSTK
jgi:transcriptional regulator with XRE-family HTH domain